LKTLRVEETTLDACLAETRHDRVILTREGRPVALVVSVEGMDEEQIRLSNSPEFWTLIEERRRQKTISRAELEQRLDRAP
jgi:antitoxin (DNA-binding transcriptional repressor) of toxin-antitoxin stability system